MNDNEMKLDPFVTATTSRPRLKGKSYNPAKSLTIATPKSLMGDEAKVTEYKNYVNRQLERIATILKKTKSGKGNVSGAVVLIALWFQHVSKSQLRNALNEIPMEGNEKLVSALENADEFIVIPIPRKQKEK